VLWTGGENNYCIAHTLQDHGQSNDLTFLPASEEINLGKNSCATVSQLASFQSFASVRQQAGFPVKVFLARSRG
jgi:hypothetical protein